MRRIAVYRIHYGLDFLGKSIESLYLHVDKVFVFWSKQPWYKKCKDLPPLNENVKEFCEKYEGWGDNKVTVFEREYDLPDNQFKKMYDEICQYYPKPDQALFMEPDMVWDHKTLNEVWKLQDDEISFNQIEFWKNENWYIKRDRPGPTLWNITPHKTMKGCWSSKQKRHETLKCYNYGFCLSPEVMKYKHEVAIQSSKYYGDSNPSKEWYQDKWLNWTPETRDLEISEAHRHLIEKAHPWVSQK
tara:strand:- start:138 stop:869 length:732 start_codon:yes stop_codon:yes gene_type:complete